MRWGPDPWVAFVRRTSFACHVRVDECGVEAVRSPVLARVDLGKQKGLVLAELRVPEPLVLIAVRLLGILRMLLVQQRFKGCAISDT